MRTYCFTGHRPDKIGKYNDNAPEVQAVKAWLKEHIVRIVEDYRDVTFIVGGALGVDTWAMDLLWGHIRSNPKYRDGRYKVKILLYLPCVDHFTKWPPHAQDKARMHINNYADEVVWVSPDRYKGGWQMQKRNEAMVNMSDGVIAVWNQTDGGTANCINYARKKGVPVLGYNPDTRKQFAIKPKRKRKPVNLEED